MQDSPNITKAAPLEIKRPLPEPMVLKPLPLGFTQRFSDSGAMWLCAEPSLLMESDNTDTSPDWQARCGDVIAVPAKPNTGNSQRSMLAGISCLAFRSQVNCGYCVPEALLGDGPFSLAVIYAPSMENEPRSLVTINPNDVDNYLFLSERDNAIDLTDKQGSFSLRQPLTEECKGFRLVIISRTKEGYTLSVNGQKLRCESTPVKDRQDDDVKTGVSGLSDLFIGCRSHRKGILKTLGELSLADVFLWPDKDILASDNEAPNAGPSPEYNLLTQYHTEVISRDI